MTDQELPAQHEDWMVPNDEQWPLKKQNKKKNNWVNRLIKLMKTSICIQFLHFMSLWIRRCHLGKLLEDQEMWPSHEPRTSLQNTTYIYNYSVIHYIVQKVDILLLVHINYNGNRCTSPASPSSHFENTLRATSTDLRHGILFHQYLCHAMYKVLIITTTTLRRLILLCSN